MRVLVRGIGNIGTSVANLLLSERALLGIDGVAVHKGTPQSFLESDLDLLRGAGAEVTSGPDELPDLLADVDFVFDCRAAGMPMATRAVYDASPALRGVVAQGTEVGFGAPFVTGINDEAVAGARRVQVGSCNTHALATLMKALAGPELGDLREADFVVVRRCEDLGGQERLVGGTVVARHREIAGTHHAAAVERLYETLGLRPSLTSSDVTTPSQLLHTVRFSLRLCGHPTEGELQARIERDPFLATTEKYDANRIFELGRRYGFQGRIYAHAIVVAHNLLIHQNSDDTVVRGWAFVPQEGNTLISTLDVFLLQTGHPDRAAICAELGDRLIRATW